MAELLYFYSQILNIIGNDLKIAGVENIWVDTQDLLLGVIYNPPGRSQRNFFDEFEKVLHSIFCQSKSV